MKILGISGKKQSGKNTVAEIIKQYQYTQDMAGKYRPVFVVAYADALKKEVAEACKCSIEFIEHNKHLFRPILQWWGTDYRRNLFGNDYWLLKLAETISQLPQDAIVLIPDVRFLNEAEQIKKCKAKLWRIVRHDFSGALNDIHSSETELDSYPFDTTVNNNGTLEELETQVINLWTTQSQHLKSQTSTSLKT